MPLGPEDLYICNSVYACFYYPLTRTDLYVGSKIKVLMIILIKKNLISEIKCFAKHHASVYLDKKCVNNGFAYVSQYITTDFEQTLRSFFPNGKTVVPMVD